jgi:uncharacterized protein (TIGR03437 family)
LVAVDRDGSTYVAGTTNSSAFPVLAAIQTNIGGQPLRVSLDQGSTWFSSTIPAPVTALASSANRPNVVFAGTRQGLFKSLDGGKTWSALKAPSSYTAFQINAIVVDPNEPDTLNVATSSGEFKSMDAGLTWRLTAGGPGDVLSSSAARPATLFLVANSILYRTIDGAEKWALLPGAPANVETVACDPGHPDVAFAITYYMNPGLYKTTDGGDTWTKLSLSSVSTYSAHSLAVSSDAVYVTTSKGIAVSRDGGINWSQTTVATQAPLIVVDPSNPRIVYAGIGVVLRTSDSGVSWSTVLSIRQNVSALAVLPGNGNTSVFVGANPGQNAFLTKWSADGSRMIYSTYLGGSFSDTAAAIAVDRAGNAYVTGYTSSTDFPTTTDALQVKNPGSTNAFLMKISPQGDRLLYSTYLGGSAQDAATSITLDGSGNVYLAGYAGSPDFPRTLGDALKEGCAQPLPIGVFAQNNGDAFVAKINIDRGQLVYSTLVGGTCAEQALGVALDSFGNAIVVGVTNSTDFPVTADALEKTHSDVFVETGFLVKLASNGSVVFGTYLGGAGRNTAESVATDAQGDVYVAGSSQGFDSIQFGPPPWPPTGGPFAGFAITQFQVSRAFGFPLSTPGAAYVVKLRHETSARLYLKYLGGTYGEGKDIAVDGAGRVWITGGADEIADSDTMFPLVHPFQAATGTSFVTQVSSDGSTILFSSRAYGVGGLALDRAGNLLVAGEANVVAGCGSAPPTSVCFSEQNAVQLTRLDADVTGITVEDPQPLIPITASNSPYEGIGGGELLVLTGEGFGPKVPVLASLTPDGKLSTSLAGITVTFDGVPAPLLSVEEGRIVCITPLRMGVISPSDSPPGTLIFGTTVMRIQSANGESTPLRLGVLDSAVGVLAVVNADGSVNSPAHPAPAGSVITVYAEGLGFYLSGADGEIANSGSPIVLHYGRTLVAAVGGVQADIVYAGTAPGQIVGVVQFNLRVPVGSPPGAYTAKVGLGTGYSPLTFDYPPEDSATFSLNLGPK